MKNNENVMKNYIFQLILSRNYAIMYQSIYIFNINQKWEINQDYREPLAKKLKYFLAHKEELNKDIEKSENVKVGLSNKAVKEIEKRVENKPTVNINNLDNYSLKDLKQIRENIERISYFVFDESETLDEEKGPVLKMTLKDNEK